MSATIDGKALPVIYTWTDSTSTYSMSWSNSSFLFVPDTVKVRRSWWRRLLDLLP